MRIGMILRWVCVVTVLVLATAIFPDLLDLDLSGGNTDVAIWATMESQTTDVGSYQVHPPWFTFLFASIALTTIAISTLFFSYLLLRRQRVYATARLPGHLRRDGKWHHVLHASLLRACTSAKGCISLWHKSIVGTTCQQVTRRPRGGFFNLVRCGYNPDRSWRQLVPNVGDVDLSAMRY